MSSAGILALAPRSVDDPVLFRGQSEPDSILVFFVNGSKAFPMRVLESDTIASVKIRIQSSEGFESKKPKQKPPKLVLGGRELARSSSCVSEYGLSDGDVIHLVVRLSNLRMIAVTTACGKSIKFQAESNRNVGYIKKQIAREVDSFVDLDEQSLICDGEELDDGRIINDIGRKEEAVILLLIRKPAKVERKTVDNGLDISVFMDSEAETVSKEPPDLKVHGLIEPVIANLKVHDLIEPVIANPKVELSTGVQEMVRSSLAGLENGNLPVMSAEGTGGTYFMQDKLGAKYIAVFKPIDEEPMAENNPRGLPLSLNGEGLKRGTKVGEGALREVAAYILDHPISGRRDFGSDEIGFSNVPMTTMVRCFDGKEKGFKIGSLQKFVKNNGSCEDMGPRDFPVEEVHKVAVIDLRLANADRHAGNMLIHKEGEEGRLALVPIDHGYCLPENFEDCTFEWLYWPQARQPFRPEALDYIRSLDADEDINLLKTYGWDLSLKCSRVLRISTMLLKKGAERGLTPYDIGNIMCRKNLKEESEIEKIVTEANDGVLPGTSENAFLEAVSEIMDRKLNEFTC